MTAGDKAVIVQSGLVTAYGDGISSVWSGLFEGKTALAPFDRFSTANMQAGIAGTVKGLQYQQGESLVMQMLRRLFAGEEGGFPAGVRLLLATTKGEVDLLEKAVLDGKDDSGESSPAKLLARTRKLVGVEDGGQVISAACASSTIALARAASMVVAGAAESVLVVACDSVTEFVYSGFSSLMALDKAQARPFDRNRSGLSLGEGAAYALVMGATRARREGRDISAEVAGWGMSCDASHMTGPSREGIGQSGAIRRALRKAAVSAKEITAISAHGTGTVYNDSMEMKGFRSVFGPETKLVYSIKGGLGHTMGSAGLIEALVLIRSMNEGSVPPTVGLENVDEEASGWVFRESRPIGRGRAVLSTNSGFGGVNASLVFMPYEVAS